MRQAGFQSNIAASVSFALGVLPLALARFWSPEAMVYAAARVVVPAMAAVWLIQRLASRWKTERCWVDQLGRGVAVVWLSLGGLFWVSWMFW
jgi:hypothetical protein